MKPSSDRNGISSQAAPAQGLSMTGIKFTVQDVLGCLDVQLDSELMRYRRQKMKQKSKGSKDNPLAAVDLNALNKLPPVSRFPLSTERFHPKLDPALESSAPFNGLPAADLTTPSTTSTPSSTVTSPSGVGVSYPDSPHLPHAADTLNSLKVEFADGFSSFPELEGDDPVFTRPSSPQPPGFDFPEDILHPLDPSSFTPLESEENLEESHAQQSQWYVLSEPPAPLPVDWTALYHPPIEQTYVVVTEPVDYSTATWVEIPEDTVAEVKVAEVKVEEITSEPLGNLAIEDPVEITVMDPAVLATTAVDLPPEISDAELLTLVAPSDLEDTEFDFEMAPVDALAVDSFNGQDGIWAPEMLDYDVADEDDPWPDQLDEEPHPVLSNGASDHPLHTTTDGTPHLDLEETSFPSQHIAPYEDDEDEQEVPLALSPARLVAVANHHAPQPLKPLVDHWGVPVEHPTAAGYFASSEALLEDEALEEEEMGHKGGFKNRPHLFTPVGIGSSLLLIFSALAVSAVLLNPEWLSRWKAQLFPQTAEQGTEIPVQPTASPSPNAYNVSSQEFLNLNLSNLSQVKPNPMNGQTNLSTVNPTA
jgi:hypothetical protein